MRIAIAADHAGYPLNERVIEELRQSGHELIDFGTHDGSVPDDYPDYAKQVGNAIQNGDAEIGLFIRAALCGDTYSAHQSREHDDCNVLCLGARVVGVELALDIVRAFVAARFTGEERHRRRLAKIQALETNRNAPGNT
jgi:ribose 5-phosphate isomerase B